MYSKASQLYMYSVMPGSLRPHGLQPTRLLCPQNFPGNTRLVCHFLLQRIFLTQGSKPVSCISCTGRQILWEAPIVVRCSVLSLCDPKNCSTPGFPEFVQTHVPWVSDGIQPSHPLSPPSSPALNLFQHHGLFQWVDPWHLVAKVVELQLQHQSFQWIFRTDSL